MVVDFSECSLLVRKTPIYRHQSGASIVYFPQDILYQLN